MGEITKLAAAKEQLVTAIDLYFKDSGPVSIHTLIRASHTILDNICANKKLERGIVQQGVTWIKPGLEKKYWVKINEAQNFFKHADKDPNPDSKVNFNPELSTYYILDAISLYRRIAGDQDIPCEMISFQLWFRINNPDLWNGQTTEFDGVFNLTKEILKDTAKAEAYDLLISACRTARVHDSNRP